MDLRANRCVIGRGSGADAASSNVAHRPYPVGYAFDRDITAPPILAPLEGEYDICIKYTYASRLTEPIAYGLRSIRSGCNELTVEIMWCPLYCIPSPLVDPPAQKE